MLRSRFTEALKVAMKGRQERAVSTLRLTLAALKDRDIAARGKGNHDGISEEEIASMLQSMIKQRRESIALYEQGGRCELAEQEREEIVVIENFLPQQLDAAASEAAVKGLIGELGATGIKDMGRVMGALKAKYAGQMDFGRAAQTVKQLLS